MSLALGIDIGTSKVAVVIVDGANAKLLAAHSMPTNAELKVAEGRAEQDVAQIMRVVDNCVQALPLELRKRVGSVGVTGQMHGVLAWSKSSGKTSSLITWQDRRCNQGSFLADLAAKTADANLKSGFGCASLAWLAAHEPQALSGFDSASTIHDYLVYSICDLKTAVSDPSDAASWGYFNVKDAKWELEKVKKAGIPLTLLPEIKSTGSVAGSLSAAFASRWQLPQDIPVAMAIGDNQASLYATLKVPAEDIGLTLGTGGQLAVVVEDASSCFSETPTTYEIRPYVDGCYAAVASSLCGGSALLWLPETIESWCRELGLKLPGRDELFARIIDLALNAQGASVSGLKFSPSFIGERHDMSLRGSVEGIDMKNFTLANVAYSLAQGVLSNLKSMLPQSMLVGRRRVVGSGNAIRKSALMQRLIGEVFALPLELSAAQEEAAQGAAMLSLRLL